MCRIEYIEEIFKRKFSSFFGIKKERYYSEKTYPLDFVYRNKSDKRRRKAEDSHRDIIKAPESFRSIGTSENKERSEDGGEESEKSRVKGKLEGIFEKRKAIEHPHKSNAENEERKCKCRARGALFFGEKACLKHIQGVNHKNRGGKRYKNTHHKASADDEEHNLAENTCQEHEKEIAKLISRVFCALGNHKCENGERKSSDDSECDYIREENQTDMVDKH